MDNYRFNVKKDIFDNIISGKANFLERESSPHWGAQFAKGFCIARISNGGNLNCAYFLIKVESVKLINDVYTITFGEMIEEYEKNSQIGKIINFLKSERPEMYRLLREKKLC